MRGGQRLGEVLHGVHAEDADERALAEAQAAGLAAQGGVLQPRALGGGRRGG